MGVSQNAPNGDRMAALRELELEFRCLCAVEVDAKASRNDGLARLAADLKKHLREWWQREHAKDILEAK